MRSNFKESVTVWEALTSRVSSTQRYAVCLTELQLTLLLSSIERLKWEKSIVVPDGVKRSEVDRVIDDMAASLSTSYTIENLREDIRQAMVSARSM